MKKVALLLGLITLLSVAWVLLLDDLIAAGRRAAIYQFRRGETVLAYPGVVMHERVRNLGIATDALKESSRPTPIPKRRRGKPAASEQQPSLEQVLATMNADTHSSTWLKLTPEHRWSIYTSPQMRPVLLGTRIVGGGLGVIFLIALLRLAGGSIFKLLFAPVMILWSYRRLHPSESHGTAKWADEKRLKALTPKRGQAPLVFGTVKHGWFGRRLLSVPERQHYEHVYVAAPTGSGKTTSIIAPNLLDEPGTRSIVVTDPKGELMPMTYAQLCEAYGKENVLVVDFGNPSISRRYNPLAFVHDATTATLFADTLVQNTGVSQKDPFWGNINRQIIAAVALHLVKTEDDPPLAALANFLAGIPPSEIKEQLLRSPAPEAVRVARSQLEAIEKNDKLLGSVFTEIAGRFEFMLDANIRAVTGGNDVDFAALGGTPKVLYLPLYLDRNEFYKPLTACFFANLFGQLTDAAKARPSKTLRTKVMCYMDEFGVMGKIPGFEARLATIRGYGIGCLMVVQSKSQLDEQYGEGPAKSILQNANTKICLSGVTDADAQMFSDLAGVTTVLSSGQSGTRRTMALWQGAGSRTRSEAHRALMPVNDLRTMEGEVFAVLRAEHPIRAHQRPYYKDRRLRRLVPDPEKSDVLAGLTRQWRLSDPGLGVEIPDREAVQVAIRTQQVEAARVKSDTAPSDSSKQNASPPPVVAANSAGDADQEPHHQESPVSHTASARSPAAPQPDGAKLLSENQLRVLEQMATGASNAEISERLGLRGQAVKNRVYAIYGKLGVQTRGPQARRDAVLIARERGVISQEVAWHDEHEH